MSIKGRPITWLDAAVKRGDVASAISAAAEMTRGTLSLDYALAIVVLMADGDPDRYDRAVARWLQRWDAERAHPRAGGDVARWKALLDELPALEAVAALAAVCDRLGLEHAGEAVAHSREEVHDGSSTADHRGRGA